MSNASEAIARIGEAEMIAAKKDPRQDTRQDTGQDNDSRNLSAAE
jgi:hypothetical protein